MKKRLLLFILSAILVLTPTVYSVDLSPDTTEFVPRVNYLSGAEIDAEIEKHVDIDALYEYLREHLALCEDIIDVSGFDLPSTDEVKDNVCDLVYYGMPEAFHVTGMGMSSNSIEITKLYVNYSCGADDYKTMLAECRAAAAILTEGLSDSNLTDVQKALLLHDRLATYCQYDTEFKYMPDSYSMYGTLVNRYSVCQGYAVTYMFLLNQVGIDSYICMSSALNHAWNILEIDGKYYYADITWDDPTKDMGGRVNHNNFLVSYSELTAQGHVSKDFDTSHNNTEFDGAFWNDSEAEFVLLDGKIYYVDTEDGYIRDYSGNIIRSVSATWSSGKNSYWPGNYTRLVSDGEYLYYSQPRGIYRLDPVTKKSTLVWTPSLLKKGSDYCIYGLYYYNGTLYAEVYNSPNYTDNTKSKFTESYKLSDPEYAVTGTLTSVPDCDVTYTVTGADGSAVATLVSSDGKFAFSLTDGEYSVTASADGYTDHTVSFKVSGGAVELEISISPIGDLNGDDTLDADDAIYLLYHISIGEGYPISDDCDYNGDGKLDQDDAIYLLYHTLLGDRYPIS